MLCMHNGSKKVKIRLPKGPLFIASSAAVLQLWVATQFLVRHVAGVTWKPQSILGNFTTHNTFQLLGSTTSTLLAVTDFRLPYGMYLFAANWTFLASSSSFFDVERYWNFFLSHNLQTQKPQHIRSQSPCQQFCYGF